MATTAQRQELARLMDYTYRHRARIHYLQRRPMRSAAMHSWHLLEQKIQSPAGVSWDCSEGVTVLCHIAGLEDPNGFGYDGWGNTGTMLHYLEHYSNPRRAKVGALVVFGPGRGDHVCMVRQPGPNPLLWSHGMERGPIWIRLEDEKRYQREPTTFLSIARL